MEMAKTKLKLHKKFRYGGILKPWGPLGGGGFMKSPHQSTRGEGGQKWPKIGPHGLRMTPIHIGS